MQRKPRVDVSQTCRGPFFAVMAYFSGTRRGEIPELQEELNSTRPDKKREAVKKVIAAMTVGKDVSSLFPHVVKCMETNEIELKKLVYLYIINYAKSQPDLAIMAVNSFRKDARQKANPLIRALAVRTMGCIRVERITEYICEPLKDALVDEDPYVRKTAAICVAKLYDISPELIEDNEFFPLLANLLSDGNAMVVANTVATLSEIQRVKGAPAVVLTCTLITKALAALNECSEWGQVYILDAVAGYVPADSAEAESVIERVVPRLAHASAAVVLSAVKVIMKNMDFVANVDGVRTLCRKLTPPLVSLLSAEPELQFIALRNINLIVQKRPAIMEKEIRVFFCKYNDPIYVKMEKLEIMVRLADLKNIDQVLHELKEYATEVDVDFVRKSVRCIGRCAIKLEKAAERCITALLELVHMKVNYVLQEAIVVIRDLFRKYPNRYEMIIKDLFEGLESLDDPEAKGAMIWIVGEYAERIDDAAAQLSQFAANFGDEPVSVQLQILTSAVKLFLKKAEEGEEILTSLLKTATEDCTNPDIRNRAFVYWRLLSIDPELAKRVVLAERPAISDEAGEFDSALLDQLIEAMGTLASVHHKPPEAFACKGRDRGTSVEPAAEEEQQVEYDSTGSKPGTQAIYGIVSQPDLLEADRHAVVPKQTVLSKETASTLQRAGLQVDMAFVKEGELVYMDLALTNHASETLTDFAVQFNVNYFGLAPTEAISLPALPPTSQATLKVKITCGAGEVQAPSTPYMVQIAVKTSIGVFYFACPCMFSVLLSERGELTREEFKSAWKNMQSEFSHSIQSVHLRYQTVESIQTRLQNNNVFFIAGRRAEDSGEDVLYFSARSPRSEVLVAEVRGVMPAQTLHVTCKSELQQLAPLFIQALNFLLTTSH